MRDYYSTNHSGNQSSSHRPKKSRSVSSVEWSVVALIFCIALAAPMMGMGIYAYYSTSLEVSAPRIRVVSSPGAVSKGSIPLVVEFSDGLSGLRAVRVEIIQGSIREDLLLRLFESPVKLHEVSIPLSFGSDSLREGPVRLLFSAWDYSRWNNSTQSYIDLNVDIKPPQVEVLTSNLQLEEGGIGVVFFRISDSSEILEPLVTVNGQQFKAFRAVALDSELGVADRNLYFSFIAVPLGSRSGSVSVVVKAEDPGGNVSSNSIPASVASLASHSRIVRIDEKAVEKKAASLVSYLKAELGLDMRLNEKVPVVGQVKLSANQVFKKTIENFSSTNKKTFSGLNLATNWGSPWHVPFSLPYPREVFAAYFGDSVEWQLNGQSVGQNSSQGIILKADRSIPVVAVYSGIVAYVGILGAFGTSVVIDHGFGLYSFYGFLSYSSVKEGSNVGLGQAVGMSGQSGLSPGNGAIIELRLQGMPINPLYWIKEDWLVSRIVQPIAEMKGRLKASR